MVDTFVYRCRLCSRWSKMDAERARALHNGQDMLQPRTLILWRYSIPPNTTSTSTS